MITGAARGIGRAAALAFAKQRGVEAVALLGHPGAALEQAAAAVRALGVLGRGRSPATCPGSPTSIAPPPRCWRRSASRAPSSTMRASSRGELVHEVSPEAWDHVVAVNLRGPFLVSRAFLPSMLAARRGRFVHVASISATLGSPGAAAYAASKWGHGGFSKSLAEELRGTGLQSVAILPGSVDTDMLVGSGFPPRMSADDVAAMIVHAALDAPDALTGSAFEMFGLRAVRASRRVTPAPPGRSPALPQTPGARTTMLGSRGGSSCVRRAARPLARARVSASLPAADGALPGRPAAAPHLPSPCYRAMVRDVLDTHGALAVVLITDPEARDEHGQPRIAAIAGAGVIVDHVELPSGRFNILVRGRARVALEELPLDGKPYRRARATVLTPPPGEATLSDLAALVAAATAFAARLRERDPGFELSLPRDAPASAVADLCAHHLVLDARERQAALETLDVGARVRRVADALALQRLALSSDPREMN